MYNWTGTEWIDKIIENNPVIIQDIIDEFECILSDEFINYAIQIDYDTGNYV